MAAISEITSASTSTRDRQESEAASDSVISRDLSQVLVENRHQIRQKNHFSRASNNTLNDRKCAERRSQKSKKAKKAVRGFDGMSDSPRSLKQTIGCNRSRYRRRAGIQIALDLLSDEDGSSNESTEFIVPVAIDRNGNLDEFKTDLVKLCKQF
jgi:hypothetical protein